MLKLNQRILDGGLLPSTLTEYERQAVAFCERWLAGEERFELYTSGSTGEPRPILLRREQMEASARLTAAAVGLRPGDHAWVCVNTAYIAGVMMLVRGLVVGMEMTVVEPSGNPLAGGEWSGDPSRSADFTALVPLQVRAALRQTPDHLNKLRVVLIGGAPIDPRLERDLQHVAPTCYHTYGMTETVSHVALRQLNGEGASDQFRPLPGVRLGLDGRGCLTICGPMTLGETVVTNDRVALAQDGAFTWLGRIDNVINSGGVKVQAEAVERAVAAAFAGRRVFVAGLPDERLGERVVAFVEGAGDRRREEAVSGLEKYERPRQFVYRAQFCETPTGKVDRRATVEAYRKEA